MRKKQLLTLLSTATFTALAALSVPTTAVVAAPAATETKANAATKTKYTNNAYIVRLAEMPVVAYDGSIKGYAATKPRKGAKIDPNSPQVVNYKSYLESRHDAVLASVGGGRKLYSYGYAFNGFAAELSAAQAEKLRATPGVLAVSKDVARKLDTSSTPAFLGLSAPGGLWDNLGGVGNAGEGIIVGIVDSGIWPENPSFSDRTGLNGNQSKDGKLAYQQVPGWHGKCTPGEQFPASSCNQKLIGAQWFNAGYGGAAGIRANFPYEYVSARDADGHGSHTSSTAAGNNGVNAVVEGTDLGKISGMAPRARIAAYKVCWGRGNDGGCFSSDSVAAIDQAVADGVDAINFSISGSTTSFLDPVEVAFLFAADAGVFVAASAGNSGPTASTVAHNSPWLTTVAAGTHDRLYTARVALGDGVTYTGVGLGSAVPSSPLLLSTAGGLGGADPTAVRLCFSGTLDPAKVAGKIVVCDRGINARVDKSLAVQQAGGVGMVLVNTSPSSLNADLHYVPTVHLQSTDRAAVLTYAGGAGATASLSKGTQTAGAVAADVASFSSRGPARAGAGDLLKPDIMAPGQDILAAVSPAGYGGRNWDFLSGTSMSSPHIAGIGALMKHAHPDWSPAAIKSALMTTASQARNDASAIPGSPFGYGAGQVVPNSAVDPGLVYDAGFNDWLAFLCGTGQLQASYCPAIGKDPSDLNYPSISIGALAGTQTVTRKVKNVGRQAETYTASVAAPAGITVSVTPASFTVAPGATKTFTVNFASTGSAALNSYAFGSLTWTGDKGHVVRSPLAIRPVALSAPGEVAGSGVSGSLTFPIQFGYNGAYTAGKHGLNPATTFAGTVPDDPTDSFVPGGPGVVSFAVNVPAGTALARFQLFDEYTDGNDDLDLYVYSGGTLVGASGSGTSAERVDLVLPAAGTYTVYVHGWQTDGPDAQFTLFTWNVGLVNDAGNLTLTAPATAAVGPPQTVKVDWAGLTSGRKYLGAISHTNPDLIGLTVVSVSTD